MKKILFAVICFFNANLLWATNNKNIIIVDAGSSGTRLYVYQLNNYNSQALPDIKLSFKNEIDHGISNYTNDSKKLISEVIEPLLNPTKEYLNISNINASSVDFYMYGTGGMRDINDPAKQQAIYNTIATYIDNNLNFNKYTITTISGNDEALYAWLDVNFLEDNFSKDYTKGIVDLGGSSFQIAYDSQSATDYDTSITLANNKHYNLKTISANGFGVNAVRKKILNSIHSVACYPNKYSISADLNGIFNYTACSKLYRKQLDNIPEIRSQFIPDNNQFVGISGIYYNFNFFQIPEFPVHSEIPTNINKICKLDWNELKKTFSNEHENFLANSCGNMIYANELLNVILPKTTNYLPISALNKLNNETITWTRGVVLYLYGRKL